MPHQAPTERGTSPRPPARARDPAARPAQDFGAVTAVDGVDLDIPPGEFFSMLGPSGSGKTTVLRMIAGFEQPTDGPIELGRPATSAGWRRSTATSTRSSRTTRCSRT